ncbi:C6 transcription factor [Verticillium dahliae]
MDDQVPKARVTRAAVHKACRPRAARACDACRTKKNKCDELYPCTYCKNRKLECIYKGQDAASRRYAPDSRIAPIFSYVRQLEDHVKNLSNRLESHSQESQKRRGPDPPAAAAEATNPSDSTLPLAGDQQQQQQHPTWPESQMATENEANAHDNYAASDYDVIPTPRSTSTRLAGEHEVSGVNRHTRNVEFYGTSSSVALLSHIQRNGGQDSSTADDAHALLVTSLHNPSFHSPDASSARVDAGTLSQPLLYSRHSRGFLDNYFSAIHYIHPILDRQLFLQRCERLWTGAEGTRVTSFAALCYSVLALGALVGVSPDDPLEGLTNLQWSRKFFDQAKTYCNQLGMVTDLEMVQCYFFLAKVCQNELSPHLCYMYVGLSVRTALAMGINRGPGPNARTDTARLKAESRTWWGLYSLETELSFAMGRPDTLGADLYHTRPYPLIQGSPDADTNQPELLEPPHCAIIKSMVDFSRLTRTVCLGIYLSDSPVLSTTALAFQIEKDLDRWIESLPEQIRPNISAGPPSTLKAARDPQWAKRQKLVLTIRYHNMRILLFGSLLLKSSGTERASIPDAHEATEKYLDSASKTIEIIYRTHEHNDFFRTWFYNTTYTVFAASIILVHVTRSSETDNQYLLERVGMAIEILENMDECVVALEAAKLLRQAKEKAQSSVPFTSSQAAYDFEGTMLLNQYWGPLDLLGGDMDLDFAFQFSDLDAPSAS